MFRGLNRLLVAALVAGAFFVAPSAALAGGCGNGSTSAENVYRDCLPSGGGGGGGHSPSGGSGGQTGGGTSTTPISSKTAKVIKHAGKDGRALAALVQGSSPTGLQSTPAASESNPGAVGSAFDLGSGPTALLIVLAGTAVLLLGATGVRGWRRSHRA